METAGKYDFLPPRTGSADIIFLFHKGINEKNEPFKFHKSRHKTKDNYLQSYIINKLFFKLYMPTHCNINTVNNKAVL